MGRVRLRVAVSQGIEFLQNYLKKNWKLVDYFECHESVLVERLQLKPSDASLIALSASVAL